MRTKLEYTIREIRPGEIGILEDMLYEAIFQEDESNPLPKDVIKQPELSVYIDSFGKKDDFCYVVEVNGGIAGAVWVRILTGEIKGYGNLDNQTPEFAISLYRKYRNQGMGTALMREMIERLKAEGYRQASLSVAKDNYAVKMYQKLGFQIIEEQDNDYLMLLPLNMV